jgi:NodT family efflux transporter outer membrane factor (OMF) lipoprotein
MKRFTVLLLPLALAACAGGARHREPALPFDTPAAWRADAAVGTDAALAAQDWLAAFGEPALSAYVEATLARNPDLQAAAARVERAAALARIAGAPLKPSVSASVSGARSRQNFIDLPFLPPGQILSNTSTNVAFGAAVSWEADLWGRLRAGARAALADLQASEAQYRGARLSLAAQTVKAWFAAVEAGQQVALAESTVASLEASTEQVRSRYEGGLRPSLDLRLSQANLEQERARLAARRDGRSRALRRLETLGGRYPAGGFDVAAALPPLPPAVPAGLPADLIARRPDLVEAERRLAAADSRWLQARRTLYPSVSLTAGGGTSSNELGDLLDGDFRVWNLAANLLQPLFQGGRLRAGVQAADAGAREALAGYAATALRAYAEVENALESERALAEREAHLTLAVEQAREAWRLAEQRYRSGLADYVTVLEAQRRALAGESEWLGVRRLRLDNRVDLHLALGGGFVERES